MEGGGGSSNKSTSGLAGFFGAGGAGYSNADLAGVPREYRASPAPLSDSFLGQLEMCNVPVPFPARLYEIHRR